MTVGEQINLTSDIFTKIFVETKLFIVGLKLDLINAITGITFKFIFVIISEI